MVDCQLHITSLMLHTKIINVRLNLLAVITSDRVKTAFSMTS